MRATHLAAGVACFARGEYFAAHEHWEDAWRASNGAEKRTIQGLIQVAAAFHHHHENRPRPAAALLRRALLKLEGAPSALDGVDVAAIIDKARTAPFG